MVAVQVIVGGLLLGAIYALFSSGLTLIWGMMNFINFAHGEFVMLGMYAALMVVVWVGGGPAIFAASPLFQARIAAARTTRMIAAAITYSSVVNPRWSAWITVQIRTSIRFRSRRFTPKPPKLNTADGG